MLVGDREYAPGDRVITRRNDRHRQVDNGTLATVTEINQHPQHMLLMTDQGQLRQLDFTYVSEHVQHAYALTGHGAQGTTVNWAGVTGRPDEFSREWAYTAVSRSRGQTTLHLIAAPPAAARDREQYAPAEPKPTREQTLSALQRAMRTSDLEHLAHEHTSLHDALKRPPSMTAADSTRQLWHPASGPYAAPGNLAHGPPRWPSCLNRRGPRLSL